MIDHIAAAAAMRAVNVPDELTVSPVLIEGVAKAFEENGGSEISSLVGAVDHLIRAVMSLEGRLVALALVVEEAIEQPG